MAVYMSMEQFQTQLNDESLRAGVEDRAKCPADFPLGEDAALSYWIAEYPIEMDDQLQDASLPRDVDVAIIGSGITGATVAYRLANSRPDLQVAMFEARGICTGATGRNGGHLGRAESYDLRALSDTFGAVDALRLRTLVLKNRDMTLDIVENLGIADVIDLRLCGSASVFKDAEERENFAKDLEFGIKNGHVPEGRLIDAEEVLQKMDISKSRAAHGAAFLDRSGTLYPRKLTHSLLKHALSNMRAMTIHPFTPVREIAYDEQAPQFGYKVVTDKGTVRAKAVFHATNAYASYLLPSVQGSKGVFGTKSHVMSVQPNLANAPQLRPGFGYDKVWHWIAARPNGGPFIYGNSSAEVIGDYNDSITLPEDHDVRPEMYKFLATTFPKHFSSDVHKKDVSYDWTGIIGQTMDGASIVGRPTKGRRGEFMSIGHNGEGMLRCISCATVAVEGLLHDLSGEENEWEPPDWFPRAYRRNI